MNRDERFNMLTHLVGAALALAGVSILVVFASLRGDAWQIVSFSVYGLTLILLYIVSTIYHGLSGPLKQLFFIFDHQAIYLLIAGTYTPFVLITLRGPWGWSLFGILWGIAIIGIVLDALPAVRRSKRILPIGIYIMMGWTIVIALNPLLENLSPWGFHWLLAGGLFYTIGILFFSLSKRFTYAHGIWHLFVLAGSACHFIAIFLHVR